MTETATKFTEQQIEDYCESVEGCYREGQGSNRGVQIIRQLQATDQPTK